MFRNSLIIIMGKVLSFDYIISVSVMVVVVKLVMVIEIICFILNFLVMCVVSCEVEKKLIVLVVKVSENCVGVSLYCWV